MVELEFMPAWYPQVRRGERALGGCVLLCLLVVGYVAWCCVSTQGRIATAAAESSRLDSQLATQTSAASDPARTAARVGQLLRAAQTLEQIRGQTALSHEVAGIEEAIPPGVLLTELSIDPSDQQGVATQPASTGRLVRLRGIASRVADVANCQASISRLQSVRQLRLSAARDLPGPGTVAREFEMSFLLVRAGEGG